MFLVVEGQDSTCPSLNLLSLFFSPKHMACHAHAHETSRRRHKNLPVCPLKDIRFWSHMSRRTTDRNYFKTFASPYRNNDEKEKEKKHTVAPVSSDSMLNLGLQPAKISYLHYPNAYGHQLGRVVTYHEEGSQS